MRLFLLIAIAWGVWHQRPAPAPTPAPSVIVVAPKVPLFAYKVRPCTKNVCDEPVLVPYDPAW